MRKHFRRPWVSACCYGVVWAALLFAPMRTLAQDSGWEVEFHGGGALASTPSGGTTTLPGSAPLPTPDPAFPSQRVSTWFLGAGSQLANGAAAQFAIGTPFAFSDRITPLDTVLARPLAERQKAGAFGFRVSRALTPRFGVEFNFDYAAARLKVPSAVSSGMQTTGTGFEQVFEGLLAPFDLPPIFAVDVSSTNTIDNDTGSQIVVTGALDINLKTDGKIIPYVTLGAGVVSNRGDSPTAELDGSYSVLFQGLTVFDETDRVTLVYAANDNSFVGLVGGGARFFLSDRSGIRVDARVHLGSRTERTLLTANPSVATAPLALAGVIWTPTNPSVQLSNNPAFFGFESSLSGPDLANVGVYKVTGVVSQGVVTVGYFWRF